MEKMEKPVAKRLSRKLVPREKRTFEVTVPSLLLRALAGAGVLTVALAAPKMTKLMKYFDRPKMQRDRLYREIRQAKMRLAQKGLLVEEDGRFSLTEKGKTAVEQLELGDYRIQESAFWDGKWRIIVFDMAERRRRERDQLRRLLGGAGFVRLQDSVWIQPYPCEEFLTLVRAHLKSGVGEMRFFVAEALESDKPLREHFRLS